MTDIRSRVVQFVTTNFYVADGASVDDEASLLDQGIVDSTGVLEVITFLEEEFGIKIEDAEMIPDNLDTIGNITAFVTRKRA